jgi:hypothetical protein
MSLFKKIDLIKSLVLECKAFFMFKTIYFFAGNCTLSGAIFIILYLFTTTS